MTVSSVRLVVVLGYSDQDGDRLYYFADFNRDFPIALLFLLFAVASLALGRWSGLRALIALVLSLLVLVWFVIPAVLHGSSPIAVAIVGSVILSTATLLASAAPEGGSLTITAGLFLLGLGWSCTLVAGSTMLTAAVPLSERAGAQGASDLVMGFVAGLGGALAGVVVDRASFNVRAGEVIGIAGLMGAGRTELAMSIFGRSYGRRITGKAFLNGKEIDVSTIRRAVDNGLAYVTEDRKHYGLVLNDTIMHNISLANLGGISRGPDLHHETA